MSKEIFNPEENVLPDDLNEGYPQEKDVLETNEEKERDRIEEEEEEEEEESPIIPEVGHKEYED